MPFQKRGNSGGGWKGGGKSFGDKKPWERGNDRGGFSGGHSGFDRPEMHKATCAQCNATCEVPFRPNGSRPVYCSNCFKRDEDHGSRDFGGARDFQKPSFKPSFDRPTNTYSPEMKSAELIKEQFRTVNAKLDTILKALAKTDTDKILEDEAALDAVIIPQVISDEVKTPAKKTAKKKTTKKK